MRLRIVTALIVLAIGVLAVMAWNRNTTQPTAPAEPPGGSSGSSPDGQRPMGEQPSAPAQDPGLEWQTPKRWVAELAGGMRLATYAVPAPKPGSEGARCAVYYFGPGQGGSVDANIERWIGEFEHPGKSTRRTSEVHGLHVSRVEVSGTYLAHSGSPDGPAGGSSGWTLLGAIAEGPAGSVFFKLTGPAPAVAAAAQEFDGLLASLRKR